jgi:hypothetical protein
MTNAAEATMTELSLDPSVVAEPSLGLRSLELDDELILIDQLTDRSFRLNATGRRIWALLNDRCTVGEVTAALERDYGLGPDEAREVANGYVAQLSELGLAAIQGEATKA